MKHTILILFMIALIIAAQRALSSDLTGTAIAFGMAFLLFAFRLLLEVGR